MPGASQQLGQGGRSPGRKRNTQNNNTSRNRGGGGGGGGGGGYTPSGISGGGLPTLDPSAVANYYGQIQTLQSTLQNQLAALKQQRIGFRGDAASMRADAKMQGQQALTDTVNSAMERGVLGSSGELSQRAGVRGATASAIADVNRTLFNSIAESRVQAQGARLSFEQGVQQVEAGAIASRMNLQAQETQNAIAIQAAQMQADAAAAQTAASMRASRRELRVARETALANAAMAGPEAQAALYTAWGLPVPPGLTGSTYTIPSNPYRGHRY